MDKEIIFDERRFHFTDNGDETATIVLMHGWGCDHSTLASVERTALACGYRVINVDFPGFGQSEEPEEVWGVEQYTRLIEHLIDSLSLKTPPVLLGHSFGGRIGILYSSRNPVEKLILVDAAGIKPKRTFRYYWKIYTFKTLKRLMYLIFGHDEAERRLDKRRAKADYGYGSVETYDDETRIYKFDKTGKGWFASGSFTDISKKDDVSYYQWTFTTENFLVIYMTGHSVEGYWYIEKLTPNELWVQWTQQDPALHPNQDKDIYKFKARKVIKQ